MTCADLTCVSSSCSVCRRRKTRCNRQSPCSNCVRSRRKEACVYDEEPQPARSRPRSIQPDHLHTPAQSVQISNGNAPAELPVSATPTCVESSASVTAEPASPSTETTQVSARNIDLMQSRIRHLEQQLSKATSKPLHAATAATPAAADIETTSSKFAGTFHIHGSNTTSTLFGRSALMSRSISHKTRLLGQSHWMNGAVPIVSYSRSRLTMGWGYPSRSDPNRPKALSRLLNQNSGRESPRCWI